MSKARWRSWIAPIGTLVLLLGAAVGLTTRGEAQERNFEQEFKEWQGRFAEAETELSDLQSKYMSLADAITKLPSRSFDVASIAEGRLSTLTATAITTSDRSSQSTLYFTPYKGSRIGLYTGSTWKLYGYTEVNVTLAALTSDTNYDVFLYDNGGTLTLDLTAWTDNTTRATSLTLQDGVYVKNGATGRRYLGTIRTTSTTTTEDSASKRFVWNYQNRQMRYLYIRDTTNSWAYSSSTWQSANASDTNRVEWVSGLDNTLVNAKALSIASCAGASISYVTSGIGLDSNSANSAQLRGGGSRNNAITQAWSFYTGYPGLGYHFLQWLESADAAGCTLYGDNGTTRVQAGMTGDLRG